MSDEHDSWFKDAFGVDLGAAAGKLKDEAAAAFDQAASTVSQVVQKVESGVEGAIGGIGGAVAGVAAGVKKVATAAGVPSAGQSPAQGGGTGSFPLGGSVGRGGKNAPNDVRAVQGALGVGVDGQCGPQTIAAIEAYQRNMGQGKPDGRVDASGATERAMAGGAKPAAVPPAPAAASGADDSGGLFGQIKKGAGELLDGATNLGGKAIQGAGELLDDAKDLGGKALQGLGDLSGGAALADSGGGGSPLSGAVDSLLGIGVGGQFSFPGIKLPGDPGFPIGTVAFGQFAGKLTVKFKPTLLSSIKAPKPVDVEADIKEICNTLYENSKFSWFGGVTIKTDTKSAGVAASFLKVSMQIGAVTLEIKAFEIGLDIKKIVKASFGSTSGNFPAFERDIKGVRYEIIISLGGALEVSPDPIAGAQAFTSGGILLAIDVALVAGPPLAAAAVIGIGIFMAGEKGKRDAAIIEGAIDARLAALSYSNTMVGSDASGVGGGPRTKAAVAVALNELGKVAASQKISLEALMTQLRQDPNLSSDFRRIHAQARQQIFSAYFAEVRRHIRAWRDQHPVLAAFTTEADDNVAVEKLVAIQFDKS